MLKRLSRHVVVCFGFVILFSGVVRAQSSGILDGIVTDATGGSVPGATVEIHNPVSHYDRSTTSDADGKFRFANVPFNPYHLVARAEGFAATSMDVEVRSAVPSAIVVTLKVASAATTVTVESSGTDLVENDSTFHTDVDRGLFDKMPLESASSSATSLVTLVSPGIAADSNGNMHALGDHAQTAFSIDGQMVTDQTSKVFSNQIPADSIQSLEVISGAPPAEFGDKTSLVIKVTTRSGMGVTTPTGAVTGSFGSFGTSTAGFNMAYGSEKWGNFVSLSGLNSGRFLDPPEFVAIHDKGNEENFFDRVDYNLTKMDTLRLNLQYSRSWFQTPNTFDNLSAVNGNPAGDADQRSQIGSYNIAPNWTHTIGPTAVFNFGGFVRHDQYNYYPSNNVFADLGPINSETITQDRQLTNAGVRGDLSWVKGIHNVKAGAVYQQTFLTENNRFGIIDPNLLPSTTDASGAPCFDSTTDSAVPGTPCATLLPIDLTRGGSQFLFRGHTDVKELALYVQDTITKGNWSFNLGLRGDFYRGLSSATELQPRLGIAYNIKPTNTVLRISYARTMETPFNENLIVATTGCNVDVIAALIPCVPANSPAGFRNEFHAGFEQAFGKYLVIDGEYLWKYTHNSFDFSVLGNTPITFPIVWHNSKIPGYAIRASMPNFHGLTALVVMSSVAARYFPPQVGGLGVTVGQSGSVFRIDHDEKFNQTSHLQYQPWKRGPWVGFNWRYDSGLVAGAVPDFATALAFNGDQQAAIGLFCAGPSGQRIFASLFSPLSNATSSCGASPTGTGAVRVNIPEEGTENDDKNPPRIAPRNLFDLAVGHDNLFHGDRYKWSLRFTVINLTNKVALYNFLSTFSGTHFVSPRSYSAELGFHF
ncbi:MAG: TonB-dependent receptor [Acidobacteria bacterium]|nr:TonB-dependent receptor [Acidobacteriota bacterium]MBS1864320.1 TonB-dependent receptor [Acidobacteriota bacterium]